MQRFAGIVVMPNSRLTGGPAALHSIGLGRVGRQSTHFVHTCIPDMANVAIIGGSRGIGEAVARHLVTRSERVLSISRIAITSACSFSGCADDDITRVPKVNLLAPIRMAKALLPALRMSSNRKIIFMGALSEHHNFPSREVANSV